MEQKNLEELYHKGELEGRGSTRFAVASNGFPPGCHNSCGIL